MTRVTQKISANVRHSSSFVIDNYIIILIPMIMIVRLILLPALTLLLLLFYMFTYVQKLFTGTMSQDRES